VRFDPPESPAIAAALGLELDPVAPATPLVPVTTGASAGDPLPGEPWTELGYAHRLVARHGHQLRHVTAWNRWLIWEGTRWQGDATGQAARWMKSVARGMTAAALGIGDKDERRAALRIAQRGESSAAIAGAMRLAATDARIAVTVEQLDADPFLLNCANGVLDLRTMTLGPHDPSLLLTKRTGAAYRPGEAAPVFEAFVHRIQPDAAMRGYIARLLGHALEGRVTSHVLPIFCGSGANGKSTLITAVLGALGDYADAADPELLMARTFDAHPTSVADLFGMRLAVLQESDQGRRLAEGTVKRLTGGDRLKARRMREDFWHFDPSHTFVMLTNHKPLVTGHDEGIWRRLRLVPFDVVVPAAERDEHLGDRLRLDLDGVLAWLAAGYAAWRAGGMAEPEAVVAATASYRAESDLVAQFLERRCLTGKHFTVRSSDLFAAWQQWCSQEGEQPGTQKAFTTELQNRGYDKRKTEAGAMWQGLGLATDD
jgi:putative DNA primase/helicase